jgi:site-specific recombinase XerD
MTKDMTVSDVLALGLKPMNPKTVNKNIQFLSAMFNWAVSEEIIEDNPARGLTVSIKRKVSLERKEAVFRRRYIRDFAPD